MITTATATADAAPLFTPDSLVEQIHAINAGLSGAFRDRACEAEKPLRREISDHFVEKLDCANLTATNVLTFIPSGRLKEKFETIGSITLNFSAPGMGGHCWAITKAQRKALLLMTVEPTQPATNVAEAIAELKSFTKKRAEFSNIIRGSIPDIDCWKVAASVEDACYDAINHERKMPLKMISLNSAKEITDLISSTRLGLVAVDQEMIDPRIMFESDWLERNRKLLPNLYETAQRKKAIQDSEAMPYKIIMARYDKKREQVEEHTKVGILSESEKKSELESLRSDFENQIDAYAKEERERLKRSESDLQPEIPSPPFGKGHVRVLSDDLIQAQRSAFFRGRNLKLITGYRGRDSKTNEATKNELQRQLSLGRLPLLNLRFKTTAQHIVMVQSSTTKADGSIEFKVYDSNTPPDYKSKTIQDNGEDLKIFKQNGPPPLETLVFKDGKFTYLKETSVKLFGSEPIGVFITDDDEMDEIQNVVYQHYKKKCDDLEK